MAVILVTAILSLQPDPAIFDNRTLVLSGAVCNEKGVNPSAN